MCLSSFLLWFICYVFLSTGIAIELPGVTGHWNSFFPRRFWWWICWWLIWFAWASFWFWTATLLRWRSWTQNIHFELIYNEMSISFIYLTNVAGVNLNRFEMLIPVSFSLHRNRWHVLPVRWMWPNQMTLYRLCRRKFVPAEKQHCLVCYFAHHFHR